MPDGNCEQIAVPRDSTVDELSSILRQGSDSDVRLSFGNNELPPDASLMDTNIVDAYEHAGNLLQVIGQAGGDADKKVAALASACAVVERLSNGVKDMEALCTAAMEPPSPRIAGVVAAGAEEAERETPKELGDGEFKMLNSMLTRSAQATNNKDTVDAPPLQKVATPSELVLGLSQRLPDLFPPSAATATVGGREEEEEAKEDEEELGEMQQPLFGFREPSLGVQPSISTIAAMRRKAREKSALNSIENEDFEAATAMTVGYSTNGIAIPADVPGRAAAAGEGSKNEGSVWMASNAKSTWLEDVMKTLEVGVVRQSGVLEKSKEGQEVNDYLNGLEEEAQREAEKEAVEAQTIHDNTAALAQISVQPGPHAGESEDEEEEDASVIHGQEATEKEQLNCSGGYEERNHMNNATTSEAMMSNAVVRGRDPIAQMVQAQKAATAAMLGRDSAIPMGPLGTAAVGPSLQTMGGPTSLGRPPIQAKPCDLNGATNARPQQPGLVRRATKIAPAPTVPMHGVTGNGIFPNPVLPCGIVPQSGGWPPTVPTHPGPKKRGRKRKNPELTDEERALVRKEQNRESAKLSRVRRKVIEAEFEGRLKALVGENTYLRKQVEGLNNQLVYMQSLLTVSVKPLHPPGPGGPG